MMKRPTMFAIELVHSDKMVVKQLLTMVVNVAVVVVGDDAIVVDVVFADDAVAVDDVVENVEVVVSDSVAANALKQSYLEWIAMKQN